LDRVISTAGVRLRELDERLILRRRSGVVDGQGKTES
jgi:hypothetical protein